MPVIATPTVASPSQGCGLPSAFPTNPTPVSCTEQGILSAPISAVHGRPILSRMRSFSLQQGQAGTLEWTMHDRAGRPVDLSGCVSDNDGSSIWFRMREHLGGSCGAFNVEGEIVTAEEGKVRIELPAAATKSPGIYFGEIAFQKLDADDEPYTVFSNIFYVNIAGGPMQAQALGPPSIMEVRLHLRDSAGSESFLLDNLAFDDAEIALAISRPVQYWNEMPPPIVTYTTSNFPFRYHWLEGIAGTLFTMAAEQFRRNNLSYSAGGVSVNDQDKEINYERAAQSRWQAFREWVRLKKASLNLEDGYGEVGSPYSWC